MAQVHDATDGTTLLAASSKLSKSARKWYDIQTGAVIETWFALRRELLVIFDRQVPFYRVMQKIEARKWLSQKETFDQYAIEKLALIHTLNLPTSNTIHLLICGIAQPQLRATAHSIAAESIETFLEKMRKITHGMVKPGSEKKTSNPISSTKHREGICRNCGKKGHHHKDCRTETTCFYCKAKGHRTFDCPALKQKGTSATQKIRPVAAVSVEEDGQEVTSGTVATVSDLKQKKLELDTPFIRLDRIGNSKCNLLALVDTGSPVSFMKQSTYEKFVKPTDKPLEISKSNLRNLNDKPLQVLGIVRIALGIPKLKTSLNVTLHVLPDSTFDGDVILGREFLNKAKLTLIVKPNTNNNDEKVALFTNLPLCISEQKTSKLEQEIAKLEIDFDANVKYKLTNLILRLENRKIDTIENPEPAVRVMIRDPTIFAFFPRRFAHTERQQLRQITDDLLERSIIRPSRSPYCSRVVPVKKKSGEMRLCVDLRPLNSRIEKQKFPFPIIEDCLSRLANKFVFTLLDLRDGFHQIEVHEDSRKYFAFATPDGQFDYNYLPFGYSESPTEFQKRMIQILDSLDREGKVIVYIDDILISSESVDENLELLEKVMTILKKP